MYYDSKMGKYLVTLDPLLGSANTCNAAKTFWPFEIYALNSASPGCFQQCPRTAGFNYPGAQRVPTTANVGIGLNQKFKGRHCHRRFPNRNNQKRSRFVPLMMMASAFAMFTCGLCGLIPTVLIGMFLHFSGIRQRLCNDFGNCNQRQQCCKQFRKQLPKKLWCHEKAPFFEMLPFFQLAGIGAYYVTGCTTFRSVVWWSALYGLVVKFLRCYFHNCQKGNDWAASCKAKRDKWCIKLHNLDRQKGMGVMFLVILVLGSALVLFLKFPVAIFWAVAFLVPKCPEPTVVTKSVELKETTKKAAKKPAKKAAKKAAKKPAKKAAKKAVKKAAKKAAKKPAKKAAKKAAKKKK